MNTEIRMLKLTNGEDIIAHVDATGSEAYHLDNPLLMRVHTKMTPSGIQEGLHLSRWMQPFCESTNFSIDKMHVVLSTEVSSGLTKYYEYSIKSFERGENKFIPTIEEPTDEELENIEDEEYDSIEPIAKAIH